MRSLLKLAVLLFCVHTAAGHWLHALLDARGEMADLQMELQEEQSKGGEAREDTIRSRRSVESPCGLRSVLLQVRDLGLGYDSDETILFKYCGGSCPRVTSNHDLTLANLLLSGTLPAEDLWLNSPCCRPTRHEDMAFLDNTHRWHKVEKLSAAACSCVG